MQKNNLIYYKLLKRYEREFGFSQQETEESDSETPFKSAIDITGKSGNFFVVKPEENETATNKKTAGKKNKRRKVRISDVAKVRAKKKLKTDKFK